MEDEKQLLTGRQAVLAALRARRRSLFHLYLSRDLEAAEFASAAKEAGVPVTRLTPREMGDLTESGKHQGAAMKCGPLPVHTLGEILRFIPPGGRDLLVLLDGIEDPRNLGAVARSAAFFGARALVLPGRAAAPLSPAASRTSAGALEVLPVVQVSRLASACDRLKEEGFFLAGVELGGDSLGDWREDPGRVALALGGEDRGLSAAVRERCCRLFSIPGKGSLNVSVAAGVAIWHVVSQRA